jgi:hypothetical protein
MLQPCRERDLSLEALGAHRVRGLWREYLEDDVSAERHLGGEEDTAHPAPSELSLERVRSADSSLQLFPEIGAHPLFGSARS